MIVLKEIERLACVSTVYLDPGDLPLLLDSGIPGHIANRDDEAGSYFYVPDEIGATDEEFEARMLECAMRGCSRRFTDILRAARRAGISYLNFDAVGGDVEGMEEASHD